MVLLFSLGRTTPLCLAELLSLFKICQIDYKILYEIGNHVVVEVGDNTNVKNLLKQSGGIVKISKQILISIKEYGQIASNISIKEIGGYKNFGVSLVGFRVNVVKICEEIKNELNLHYILPKEEFELSSAQILNKNILEFIIVKMSDGYSVFQTLGVQDINYWSKKDAGRPFINDRLGMLPLKVARMMINLGKGSKDNKITILDPFCGMGSILQEAIDLGVEYVVGSDINPQVLDKCRQNICWFKEKFKFQHVNTPLFVSDAAKISGKLKDKVDLIVTEPFLGDAQKIQNLIIKNQKDNLKCKNIIKGLEKMYTGCLKDWKKLLKTEGRVCIIVPEIIIGGRLFTLPFVEICAKTGYNIIQSPLEYSREEAVVRRKIWLILNQAEPLRATAIQLQKDSE